MVSIRSELLNPANEVSTITLVSDLAIRDFHKREDRSAEVSEAAGWAAADAYRQTQHSLKVAAATQ